MATEQASLSEAALPETDSVSVTRTFSCQLESSNTKNEQLKTAVDEFQAMLDWMSDMIASVPEHEWNAMNNQFYRMVTRKFDDREISAACAQRAAQKVADTYKGWRQKGKPGGQPKGEFGTGDYLQLNNQSYSIHKNERGYGLKANFIPYNPVWWHLRIGEHQRDYIEKVTDGNARFGTCEIFYNDGDPYSNITVTWDVEVYKPADVRYSVGVDIGERTLYAAAVRDAHDDAIEAVEMESGDEFRHHREELSARKDALQEQGDLRAVKDLRNQRRKYTNHVTHRAAKEIVQLAAEHDPSVIQLEDLSGYRETATDPIHDWPFYELQEKIAYKATERGIPVVKVDPANTSVTCRKCGHEHPGQRHGDSFECFECGYEVHADVNAAMNLAAK